MIIIINHYNLSIKSTQYRQIRILYSNKLVSITLVLRKPFKQTCFDNFSSSKTIQTNLFR